MSAGWGQVPELPPRVHDRDLYHAERHVTRRCSQMNVHYGENKVPIPCEECFSVESVWRRIPYEPDSRGTVRASWEPIIMMDSRALDRCDPATGRHSMPHKGCILR